MRGVFVTGTGTGVGKSIVAAALCASLVARGDRVVASKPLLSGLDESPPAPWPHDHELLALAADDAAEAVSPVRYGPAVSPHLAARLAGDVLEVDAIAATVRARFAADAPKANQRAAQLAGKPAQQDPIAVVEGAGGLLVPIDDEGATMADLAVALGLPLLIAAHPGLGTINHVALTLEAARARGLAVAGIVLTPWPETPTLIETDNRDLLTRQAGAPVVGLSAIAGPDRELLAAAGADAGLPALV